MLLCVRSAMHSFDTARISFWMASSFNSAVTWMIFLANTCPSRIRNLQGRGQWTYRPGLDLADLGVSKTKGEVRTA